MKVIIDTDTATDNVVSVAASSADAAFPATNLQNDWPSDLWKAASGTTATLTIDVSKGSAVMLFNTNATAVTVTAGSGESFANESGWVYESGYVNSDDAVTVSAVYSLPGVAGRLWADYTAFAGPHVVTLSLTAASAPSAGIVRAGMVETFNDPAPDIQEGSKDFSIEAELNNGASYFRKRNIVRTFSGIKIVETRANAFVLKHDIFDAVGPEPLAIRLLTDGLILDDEFVLFAKRTTAPTLKHVTPAYTEVNMTLQEVV